MVSIKSFLFFGIRIGSLIFHIIVRYFICSIDVDQSYNKLFEMVEILSKIVYYVQSKQIRKIYVGCSLVLSRIDIRILFVSTYNCWSMSP